MRISLVSLLVACAAFTSPAWAIKSGDTVTPDALNKAEILQGEIPKTWEPGKVYIIEYWATWCGPCVASIPHLDGLYDKYKDNGLRVIGVCMWDEGKERIAKFVKDKGDGMSYPVLYTGKIGSAFDKEWIKTSTTHGIPHAFFVKDGKLLMTSHPAAITEKMVEDLLAGGERLDALVKPYAQAEDKVLEINRHMVEFSRAARDKNVAGMEAEIAKVEKIDPRSAHLPPMRERLKLVLAKKDGAAPGPTAPTPRPNEAKKP